MDTPVTEKKRTVTILIIDDDEDDYCILKEYLGNIQYNYSCQVDWCPTYQDALTELRKDQYDIYFIDFLLGAKTGLDLIQEAAGNNSEKPVVLLTGQGNHGIDIRAMQAGAVDYLVKSELNTEKLERCMRYALSRYDFLQTLKANGQKFRSVFERSQDCVFIADEELVFTDVNNAGCLLFEYTKAEILEMSLYQLLANKDDVQIIREKLLNGHGLSDTGFELLPKSKNKIISILSISMESDGKGSFYAQGIIHDITALKKSESALLMTEKIKSAGKLAMVLAHEVRNPLNNIGLSAEQLMLELSAEERNIYINIITRNTKRIDGLITELLDSSRPTEIELKRISLQSVLEESVAAASDRITLKSIHLEVRYPEAEAWIMGDASKLKIAFLNIIINGIEAMKTEGGQLRVGMYLKAGNYIVYVTDNGEGIDKENLKKLFEPYYTSKQRGMGLGLAATVNIIQSHHAFIEVHSTVNVGTNFLLTFTALQA